MPGQALDPAKAAAGDFLGKKTMILGEVKQGKTALVTRLLGLFREKGQTGLVVMDLAPDLIRGVGGKMDLPPDPDLVIHSPHIVAPRLTGRTPEEVLQLAERNGRTIDRVLGEYLARPGQVLFVNDVSLYLQAREPEKLHPLFTATPTLIMNSYYGQSLGGGDLGILERKRVDALTKLCDIVINL